MAVNTRVEYVGSKYDGQVDVKARWWYADDNELYRSVFAVAQGIERNAQQQSRTLNNLRFARLYANYDIPSLSPGMYARMMNDVAFRNRVTLNVIKSCIDTVSAQISSNKPRPLFLTNNGDFSQQRRAKRLTEYMDGVFEETAIYDVGKRCFVDACVFGTGFMKIYVADGCINVERVFPDEILVDEAEGVYGEPRQLHQRRLVSRDVLLEMFPDQEHNIKSATTGWRNEELSLTSADLVLVVESWHLPSGKGAKDGRHAISIENCTLFAEPYDKHYFPFATIRWSPALLGYFGQGLAEELVGIQLEINKLLKTIQQSQHFMSVPRIFVDAGSNLNSAHINNEIGAIVKYTGAPPVMSVAQAQSPEIYQHLERLYNKAYEITGVSQMSAQSKRPEGIEAGVALRTLRDIQSERFILTAQSYERFYMDAADIIIDLSETIADDASVSVVDGKRKRARRINWKDVRMDRKDFKMQVFPTNILPHTPAGRLQTVQELMQSGFIDPEQGLGLLDFPDLQNYMNSRTAAVDDIKMCIEKMLDDGIYLPPEPYMNLNLALQMVQSAYLRARTDEAPEDRLELLRTFMSDVETLLQAGQQVQAQQQVNVTQAPVTPSVSVMPEVPVAGQAMEPPPPPVA